MGNHLLWQAGSVVNVIAMLLLVATAALSAVAAALSRRARTMP
jgi:hypothetical protein